MSEIWKDIEGFEGVYQCSDMGGFKSLARAIDCPLKKSIYNRSERILKPSMESNGYFQIGLSKNKKQTRYLTHRIIAKAFIGNPLNKEMVNHINGIKTDNRVENLEWCTRSENAIHSFVIGLQDNKGEAHPRAKASNEIILQIRSKYQMGIYGTMKLAKEFGFSNTNIKDIVHRRIWNHI